MAKSGAQLDVTLDRLLDGGEGRIGLDAGETGFAANRLEGLTGSGRFTYRRQALTAQFRVEAKGLATPQARLGNWRSMEACAPQTVLRDSISTET